MYVWQYNLTQNNRCYFCLYGNKMFKTPTLPDTPLQLCEDVRQQDFTQGLVELCEHVTDGVQSVVTRCRHPLGFLRAKDTWALKFTSSVALQKKLYYYIWHLTLWFKSLGSATLTSVCCSGSFMLSNMRNTILKRSCHQCFSKVWP